MKKRDYIDRVSEYADRVCNIIEKMNDNQAKALFDSITPQFPDYHYTYMFNVKDYVREEISKNRSDTILIEALSDVINRYYFDMDSEYETIEDMKYHLRAIKKLYNTAQDILLCDILNQK